MDRHYFDEIAQWDRVREREFSEAVRDHAISVANLHPGTEGLAADIGVGSGFIAYGLLDKGLRVIAVDHSINMLRVLQTKVPNARALAFCQGDDEHLPLCRGAVDYVFANMCLHHLVHPWHAVGEMARILHAGGRLVITDLEAHRFAFLTEERATDGSDSSTMSLSGGYAMQGLQTSRCTIPVNASLCDRFLLMLKHKSGYLLLPATS